MKAGWQTKSLGEVAKIGAGNSAPQGEPLFEDGLYPFFRTSDAGRIKFGDIHESADYLNEEGVKGLRLLPKGTILFPKSGASTFLNHRVMLGVDGYVSSHLATIIADASQLNERFLLYFLATISAQDLVQDHAYPSLNLPIISAISLSLPPLPEQQRIVAILDEAFAGIATATANAEKNLANARELFESTLQSAFDGNGKGWEIVKLSAITSDISDGDHQPPPKAPDGIPFITISNIDKATRQIDFASTFKVPRGYYEALKVHRKPRLGDVLYTVTGSFGIPVLVASDLEFCFQRHIGLIRPSVQTDSKWLYYLMMSPQVFRQADESATGTAQKTVSLNSLRSFVVPKISLAEQLAIVAKLNELSVETKRLEAVYQQKLVALDELKKSILNQAFSGQLQ